MLNQPRIVVIGLGYVGLPLAVALARDFQTIGFDIDRSRIDELRAHHDRTNEVEPGALATTSLKVTADPSEVHGADLYIVTVPTPVDASNEPDLRPLLSASRSVGQMLDASNPAIVVFESTVYPGVTEDICGPAIEQESGLRRGEHFRLGYSPERINPGDREHTVDRITKVIAGEDAEVTEVLADVYGRITTGGVFRAASIRTAEAAKVIENAQRDINIAFMNEVSQIFAQIGLSVWDVLEAAGTKWNFLKFQPGLVGGHCIGVDPYYLSHLAQKLGHEPRVILAGRAINDRMGDWVAQQIKNRIGAAQGTALVLGTTFKENVPDIRNSKVIDVIEGLTVRGFQVTVHDPLADPVELRHENGVEIQPDALGGTYDVVLCAVAHEQYRALDAGRIDGLVSPGGLVADLKGVWRDRVLRADIARWSL